MNEAEEEKKPLEPHSDSGSDEKPEDYMTDEELLKKRIEEIRKRDPFIYR